jgi:hypothetical protein
MNDPHHATTVKDPFTDAAGLPKRPIESLTASDDFLTLKTDVATILAKMALLEKDGCPVMKDLTIQVDGLQKSVVKIHNILKDDKSEEVLKKING